MSIDKKLIYRSILGANEKAKTHFWCNAQPPKQPVRPVRRGQAIYPYV